ncbi:hypothetical protein STAL104432_32390 [Streptomyces albus]
MHHHQTDPVRHHVVHLAGYPGALLVARPLGALLRPVGEQRQFALQTVRALPQRLHEPPPGPHVQAEQHRRCGDTDRQGDGHQGDEPPWRIEIRFLSDALVQPEGRHRQYAERRHRGQQAGDAPRHLRRGERVEADDAQHGAHVGRYHGDGHQDDGYRPAPAQHQRRSHDDAQQCRQYAGQPRLVGEALPLQRALRGGDRRESDVEHRTPWPLPPPRPAPRTVFPRLGHADHPTTGPCPLFRPSPRNVPFRASVRDG